jgi:hypothetical protein
MSEMSYRTQHDHRNQFRWCSFQRNHISGVMVSVLTSSVVDRGFEPRVLTSRVVDRGFEPRVLTSSVVDREFEPRVLTSSVVDRGFESRVLTSSVVDRGFESRSVQTKVYKICISLLLRYTLRTKTDCLGIR